MSSALAESVRFVVTPAGPLAGGAAATLIHLARGLPGLDRAFRLILVGDPGVPPAAALSTLVEAGGWNRVAPGAIQTGDPTQVTPDDRAAAVMAGVAIQTVVAVERDARGGVRAYAGPAVLSGAEPLSALCARSCGLLVAFEARPALAAPPWLCRLTFAGIVPAATAVRSAARGAGLDVAGLVDHETHAARWVTTGPHPAPEIEASSGLLVHRHRITTTAFRYLPFDAAPARAAAL